MAGTDRRDIPPGSPWENGYNGSFNGSLRDELLKGEIFYSLAEAKVLIEAWRQHYNAGRPHSGPGNGDTTIFSLRFRFAPPPSGYGGDDTPLTDQSVHSAGADQVAGVRRSSLELPTELYTSRPLKLRGRSSHRENLPMPALAQCSFASEV